MCKYSLEITIPVLNEERRVENGVIRTVEYMNNKNIEYTIMILDNGSNDNTESISRKLCDQYPNTVKYMKISQKGVGLALQASWVASKSDIVGYMDIDLSTDLNHLLEVYDLFEKREAMIVNGSRLLRGAIVKNRTLLREITSRCYNIILKLIFSVSFTDAVCGFKFLRRELAVTLLKNGINNEGWFFCTEILIKSMWQGIPITEIPVCWTDNHDSKVKVMKLSMNYLKNIHRLYKDKNGWIKRTRE